MGEPLLCICARPPDQREQAGQSGQVNDTDPPH